MLICPQCQFENPNANKFCQRCGTSLTQEVCAECGTTVALSAEQCPNCGARIGTVWWAIISNAPSSPQLPTALPLFLDQEQRYKLIDPLPPQAAAANTELQMRVLDCQPFQPSPLEVGADSVMEMPVPAIAKTYIILWPQLYHALPAVHDAWQQEGQQVLLIADRSDWSKLIDLWRDDKTTPQQILGWLYEITKLWITLEPWHCRQSLLEISNLRVDEKEQLALQRLYAEPETGITLQDLGRVWQRLFQESQRTQFGALVQLLADLQASSISTINDLRSRLEGIMGESKVDATSTADLSPETAVVKPETTTETQRSARQSDATPLKSGNPPTGVAPQVGKPAQAAGSGGSSGRCFEQAEVAAVPESSPTPTVSQSDEPQESLPSDTPTVVLPMQLVSLEDVGRTDVGQQRDHNEDCYGIETTIHKIESPGSQAIEARGLYILCDGMGGHAGGEVASTLAVKTLQQYFQTHWQQQLPTEATIREAVRLANQAIYDLNQNDARSGVGRMGTTLVMVLLQGTQVAVAHVGDSRLYQMTPKQGLKQVTVDHEVGQREVSRGVEPAIAYARADAYQLTQALGPRDENFVSPDVRFLQLNEDTLLLLASDGLSDNNLIENFWHTHLETLLSSEASLEQGVSNLINVANEYNGHDNITAVVIRAKVLPSQS